MGYAATIGVIMYWNPDTHFVIQRSHHSLFDEYNYCIYIEDNNTTGDLVLQPRAMAGNCGAVDGATSLI